jgi:hypothetical protein
MVETDIVEMFELTSSSLRSLAWTISKQEERIQSLERNVVELVDHIKVMEGTILHLAKTKAPLL